MLDQIKQNAKNLIGWKTKRKIVVLSVDDYGNVRLSSQAARKNLDEAGYKAMGWFDELDTLETYKDLEMLYDVLTSVRDAHGKHAVITPFVVPCNIDFERLKSEDYTQYRYELLPETFAKLAAIDRSSYEGTWELWQDGIRNGLMVPQFHGREHLNIQIFEERLKTRDQELLTVLENRSFTKLTNSRSQKIGQTSAFGFWDFQENFRFKSIIEDGLNAFEKVFGYRSVHFIAPAGKEHHIIYKYLKNGGISYIDTPLFRKEHQGLGKYKTRWNYTGKKNATNQVFLVRNVVFELVENQSVDWVGLALIQIESAFRWQRPAIISSHRVNFCGHIDPVNRKENLVKLRELLSRIVTKWPEVEFMSADQLGNLISKEK